MIEAVFTLDDGTVHKDVFPDWGELCFYLRMQWPWFVSVEAHMREGEVNA